MSSATPACRSSRVPPPPLVLCQLTDSEDAGGNKQNALSPLVHGAALRSSHLTTKWLWLKLGSGLGQARCEPRSPSMLMPRWVTVNINFEASNSHFSCDFAVWAGTRKPV